MRIECPIVDYAQEIPQGQTFAVEIVRTPPPRQTTQQKLSQRKRTKYTTPSSLMKLRQRLPPNAPTQSRGRGSAEPGPAIQGRRPRASRRADRRNQVSATAGLVRDQNTRRNVHAPQGPGTSTFPNSDRNPNVNQNADRYPNTRSRNLGRNSNHQQPSTA